MKSFTIIMALTGLAVASPVTTEILTPEVEAPGNMSVMGRQSSNVYRCDWPTMGQVNVVLDDSMPLCTSVYNGENVPVNWYGGRNWYLTMFGTRCRAFIDRDRGSANTGEAFGHVDCPGMKDIKIVRRDGWNNRQEPDYRGDLCFSRNVQMPTAVLVTCWSEASMTWDGCLSCGNPV